jgi:phenylacetate-coenzyme A ligase PaaK-like adenylate-forming protein
MTTALASSLQERIAAARTALDAHVREIVAWHFSPETGTPFWLDALAGTNPHLQLNFDPRKEIRGFADLRKFGFFQDEWLRGGPVRRWVPRAYQNRPIYVFETGGTTGIPKTRINIEDFRIDYEQFSATLPDQYFPKGANWLMLGPSGPRRLRLAVEHLCQYRGGICFCIDLDPRWVVKCLKRGWVDVAKAYMEHCIEQAITILEAGHDIKCMFATPKLLEALALELEKRGTSLREIGITGIFCGGTEMTPQWMRFTIEELLGPGIYIAPTYGNTLMGLAVSEMPRPEDGYKITYYAPQPRAVIEVVDFDDHNRVVDYGQEGRVLLTTLTKEFFMPRFPERDEGVRELPCDRFPWDGVSGVKPYRGFAATTTVGVY